MQGIYLFLTIHTRQCYNAPKRPWSSGEGMKFEHLILRKVIKIVANGCQIIRLKCTQIDFGWGSAPDPAGGAYSAPPEPLAGIKGAYF